VDPLKQERRRGRGRSVPTLLGLVAFGFVLCALQNGAVAQPALPKDPADLSKPFSHDTHLDQLLKDKSRLYTCADCHTLKEIKGDKGKKSSYPICETPRMPYPGHDDCISCHPTAFFVRPLQICTNCHADVAITRKVDLKEQTGTHAPLRTVFDHRLHLSPKMRVKKQFGFNKDCSFCHPFLKGGEKVDLPGHAQCCECHTKKEVEPNINDCAGCHKRPKNQKNPRSMVRKFSHVDHKTDPLDGASLPCARCHYEVEKAKTVAKLKLPKMATCVECHQGEVAFSYADCLKCHDKGIETRLLPKSHPKPPAADKKK